MNLQLHASGLATLSRCGESFRRRYIDGEKTRSAPHLVTGSAVDRSVTRNLTSKIETGALLTLDEAQTIARDALAGLWQSEDVEIPRGQDPGVVRDESIDKAVRLAEIHHTIYAPKIQAARVQWEWVLNTPLDGLQLAGTCDIVETNAVVRDLKTSKRTPNADVAETSIQLSAYAMAIRAFYGHLPERLYLDYTIQTPKRQDLKWAMIPTTRSVDCIRALWERVHQAYRVIEAGLFTPAPADAWWCSNDYCGYFQSCKYARKPTSASVLVQLETEKGKLIDGKANPIPAAAAKPATRRRK